MLHNYLKTILTASLLIFLGSQLTYAQTFYNFTNCGATGGQGPSQTQANAAYASTNLNGQVTVTAGIQYWQVPSTGLYSIEAVGAKGGGVNGGKGARMIGEFNLTAGQTLKILVGQQGEALLVNRFDYSGGGGSFVTDIANAPLVVAGGGGGAHAVSTTADGATGTAGMDGAGGHSNAVGGTGGMGGSHNNQTSDGGAGFTGNGSSGNPNPAPQSFINGGQGGCNSWATTPCANGGFGGGGGTNRNSTTWWACGGGGGYSGGGSAYGQASAHPFAGGGGSINNGNNQVNTSGIGTGDGMVVIASFPTGENDAGVAVMPSPVSNCVGTYPVTAQIYNAGTNQITSVTVNWTINGVAQTPYVHATLLDTSAGTGPNSANINLGNITLTAGVTDVIKVWTLQPNGVNDTINFNDTIVNSVTGIAFPTINLGPDVSICPEDSITFDAGTGRDSVLWSTTAKTQTIRVNAVGMYHVGVFENGCESRDTVILSHHPAAPSVDIGPADTTICSNDSLILDATTAGVTYQWQNSTTNPTQTVKTAGTYWVIIEDANTCNKGDTINVSLHADPTVSHIVAPGNNICFGVPVTFTANGQSDGSIMYQWKINGTNSGGLTASNTFMPTIVDGDIVSVDLVTDLCVTGTQAIPSNDITMSVNPEPRAITGPDTVIENTTATYAIGFSANPLMWTIAGGTAVGTVTSNIISVEWGGPNTSAMVTCSETEGSCTRPNEKSVVVVSIVGVKENKDRIVMGYAYPNPAQSTITIPLSSKGQWDVSLNLYDVTGKHVKAIYEGAINGSKNITFALDDLQNGLYFYKVTTSDGYESVKKITVQH